MKKRQKEKRANLSPNKKLPCSNERLNYIISRSKMQIW